MTIEPPQASDPREIAERLDWRQESESPTGRRVLDVRPGTRTILSASADPEAARRVMASSSDPEQSAVGGIAEPAYSVIDWAFDDDELVRLRGGFVPSAMEDKWRILIAEVGKELRLYFLRSWTDQLLFVVEIVDGHARRLVHTQDQFSPIATARAVLDGYLLERPCVIPAPPSFGEDKFRLMSFGISMAGRRCDFVEPDASVASISKSRR